MLCENSLDHVLFHSRDGLLDILGGSRAGGFVQGKPFLTVLDQDLPDRFRQIVFGDRLIEGGDSLVAAIRSHAPGDTISVTYAAQESEQPSTVDVVLGETR